MPERLLDCVHSFTSYLNRDNFLLHLVVDLAMNFLILKMASSTPAESPSTSSLRDRCNSRYNSKSEEYSRLVAAIASSTVCMKNSGFKLWMCSRMSLKMIGPC